MDDTMFYNQNDVDQYVIETEELAENVDNEQTAIQLYKHISYLKAASELYFVPNIVFSWEEMALSYIESPDALFKHVHYEMILEEYKNFFDAAQYLELAVIEGLLPIDFLFENVFLFNNNIDNVNKSCEQYGIEKFTKYCFNEPDLNLQYQKWLKAGGTENDGQSC